MRRFLAVEFATTIRHDGQSGVTDDLPTPEALGAWVAERAELFDAGLDVAALRCDEELLSEVLAVRQAVRALFARAVRPGPPSPADAHRLLPVDEAMTRLNTAVAREPLTVWLEWPDGAAPSARPLSSTDNQRDKLIAALARATTAFLTGPFRERLRACTAPRCVRYFVQGHGRQEWCKPGCADRARAARYYQRQRAGRSARDEGAGT
ncbi:ABATE domain-containing protein [Streptomyces sp. DSM 44915]|uniref:ABATE domain-containing protein n=1 Tax=Streptomyces chisholmiae TaxID=3075540 RepID=A0ABU2JXU0_9ACTN|nr:ABATE domain-containing protein [Streptomyces sp. DSM 44915]MDT0269762.1 ABATE domain-containing protein [Streptomyces sp. DSM 44915]